LAGFVYACGFCGHGFALAPAVGEVVARFIRTGQLDPVILPFRPDRFGVVA
jgi:sarcosine oxidase subunit beta